MTSSESVPRAAELDLNLRKMADRRCSSLRGQAVEYCLPDRTCLTAVRQAGLSPKGASHFEKGQLDIQIRCAAALGKKYRLSLERLKKAARKILRELGWKNAGLSVWLVGDRRIRTLNRQHLKHDRPTDVLAFSQLEGKKIKAANQNRASTSSPLSSPPFRGRGKGEGEIFLGDIVISLDTTARQAARYKNDFFYELSFYLCHGILHLMGCSDATKRQALSMQRKQTAILKRIGLRMGLLQNG